MFEKNTAYFLRVNDKNQLAALSKALNSFAKTVDKCNPNEWVAAHQLLDTLIILEDYIDEKGGSIEYPTLHIFGDCLPLYTLHVPVDSAAPPNPQEDDL